MNINFKTIFKPHRTLRQQLVAPKDKSDPKDLSGVVYRIPCKDCNKVYIGESARVFADRFKEHSSNSRAAIKIICDVNALIIHQRHFVQENWYQFSEWSLFTPGAKGFEVGWAKIYSLTQEGSLWTWTPKISFRTKTQNILTLPFIDFFKLTTPYLLICVWKKNVPCTSRGNCVNEPPLTTNGGTPNRNNFPHIHDATFDILWLYECGLLILSNINIDKCFINIYLLIM